MNYFFYSIYKITKYKFNMISNTVFNMNPYYSRFIDVYEENKQRYNEITKDRLNIQYRKNKEHIRWLISSNYHTKNSLNTVSSFYRPLLIFCILVWIKINLFYLNQPFLLQCLFNTIICISLNATIWFLYMKFITSSCCFCHWKRV